MADEKAVKKIVQDQQASIKVRVKDGVGTITYGASVVAVAGETVTLTASEHESLKGLVEKV